ncbi:uncharacterized protein in xynA 3'region-like, partial [Saccostrea cucullata]|uniref:uncharacterized protein in xynA 3'region-like n=1 Tax=Saccostrea cuccullata TaxID=36930 RepID=UPI002ED4EAC1
QFTKCFIVCIHTISCTLRDCVTKSSPEEELSVLFDELKFILENDAYDESQRKSLRESYPEYLKIIEKRKNDLLKDDHGIVIAGEPSAGKSTLTNKLLQKRIFKCRKRESTSTLCTIRNSEDIRIITEGTNGETQTISLPSTCNIETESGQKLLRDTLKNLTSSQESKHFCSIDVGFPIPFLKGNTIIIDAPGIDDSGDFTKKLMDYLPNAVSFIFVIDVNRLGCMHDEKLAGILRSLINLQIEDEMPCFDPKEVIFITNKWDTIARDGSHDKESSDKNQDEKIWNELKNAIKTIWPFVKDENIFKMIFTM